MQQITVNELAATTHPVLIDVREPDEYSSAHARGALNIPLGELRSRVAEVPSGSVYLICETGRRSALAAGILDEEGRSGINVDGGTSAWMQAGFPTEQ